MHKSQPGEPSTTAHEAWDKAWATDAGRRAWLDPAPDVVELVPALRERGARDVLDLGCGVGRHALLLAAEGFTAHAMDASAEGVEQVRQAAEEKGLRVATQVAPMDDLPYDPDSLDYVVAWNVVYHGTLDDTRKALAEVRRVLRPGGLFQGTFLSKANAKFGRGREIAPDTYVIDSEDEKGHPHCYCDEAGARVLLEGFEVATLADREQGKPGSHHWHFLAELCRD